MIGTVYQIANPVLIWWGEGDQKIFVDGESFPSTFGTGTEDDYGYAYGNNQPFTRPYHAQTRVDGPASGGHVSLNRWYVLDALPYRTGIQFDQEMWHWMPCKPTWAHVIYWYAKPGTPGPGGNRPQDARPAGPRHSREHARSPGGRRSPARRDRRQGRKRSGWPIAPAPSTSSGTTPSRAIA